MTTHTKAERLAHANQLIRAISEHGRQFFKTYSRVAYFTISSSGKIWFVDDYNNKPIYTHYAGRWRDFSHGGTLRRLVDCMVEYILTGKQLRIGSIAPDIWDYEPEEAKAVKAKAKALPIISSEGDIFD